MGKIAVTQSALEYLYVPLGGGGGPDPTMLVSQSVLEMLYVPTSAPTNPQLQVSQSVAEVLYHVTRVTPPNIRISQSVLELLFNVPTTPPPPPGAAFYSCGVISSWVPCASAQEASCEGNG